MLIVSIYFQFMLAYETNTHIFENYAGIYYKLMNFIFI